MRCRMLTPALPFAGFAVAVSLSVARASPGPADDTCAGFTWNVKHERALFGEQARRLSAGKDAASSPMLATDHLYRLELLPRPEVTFVASGKHRRKYRKGAKRGGDLRGTCEPSPEKRRSVSRCPRPGSVGRRHCERRRHSEQRLPGASRLQRSAQDRRVRAARANTHNPSVQRRSQPRRESYGDTFAGWIVGSLANPYLRKIAYPCELVR
jgi:hypothetical protein